ncbi:unnamed protein product [Adineta steineri]|uniref:GOLD domain-containing protein n=1 Tax=Adineta steineri TaxID=433720 RepID=A0A818RVC4_9BILA|nr:unnamed protein product [Adineta steineri]
MVILFLLLILSSYTYAYVDESALATLQTLEHWNTFRIIIPHTADECFYLETKFHDTIHVIYQVLRGGDSNIRVVIQDPIGNITFFSPKQSFGWYDVEKSKIPGTYKICFTNEQYFTAKTVYIGVLAAHQDRLHEANLDAAENKNNNETAALEESSDTMMTSLGNISHTLYRVSAFQTAGRVHEVRDLYTIQANKIYVQHWAIIQILTMIICSMIQVYSIRRLFASTISKKTSSNTKFNQSFNSQPTPHFIYN